MVKFASKPGPWTWALTEATATSSIASARIETVAPATWAVGFTATFRSGGGVVSIRVPVVKGQLAGPANRLPGSESSFAEPFTTTRYMVDGSNRGFGVKVIRVPSGDQEMAPGIHAPSEGRWAAKEL